MGNTYPYQYKPICICLSMYFYVGFHIIYYIISLYLSYTYHTYHIRCMYKTVARVGIITQLLYLTCMITVVIYTFPI